jgi:iron complex transport system substrate-binding protein
MPYRDTPYRCVAVLAVAAAAALAGCAGTDDGDVAPSGATGTTEPTGTTGTTGPTGTTGSERTVETVGTTADGGTDTAPAGPTTIEHVYGTTEVPTDPQRVVALSEEFLLADLLALGVTPIASTSNDPGAFLGLDPADTEGIENIASVDFNLEQLAALRPDLLLAYPDYIELVGYDLLAAIAPTVAIGTVDSDWREQLELTAAVFGAEDLAAERIAAIDATLDEARGTLDGTVMSVASVSPGPFIRAYTDERTALTEIMADLGVVFTPDGGNTDDNGRIEVSLEQLGILDGDLLVLLQSSLIDGVDTALSDVEESPLWATLPAVRNGAVIELDQLAYFGADGVAAFASDLAAAVEASR